MIDVTTQGVKGDGTTDNTVALQALINTMSNGTRLYFPLGRYKVAGGRDFSARQSWSVVGDGMVSGSRSTEIFGGLPNGNLITSPISLTYQIRDIGLCANAPGGTCFSGRGNCSSFENVSVTGWNGIVISAFSVSLRSVRFNGTGVKTSNIGLLSDLGTDITCTGCDWSGWTEGVRASGCGFNILGGRFEVNHIGMNLGNCADGSSWSLSNSFIGGVSFEANDLDIYCYSANATYSGITSHGSTNAPSGYSQNGIIIHSGNPCLTNVQMGGAYSGATWNIGEGGSNSASPTLINCSGNNGGTGKVWNIMPGTKPIFIGCNNPQ